MKKLLVILLILISASASAQKIYPDSSFMFRRLGLVFSDSAGRNFEAPTCIYEGSPQILTGLSKVFKIWFTWTDASSGINIGYAESADGVGHWFRKATAVIAGHRSSCVRKFGSTYFCYAALGLGGSQIDEYSSTDGVTWTSVAAGIITLGTSGTWNGTGLFNSWVDSIGSTYYMIVDGQSIQYGFSDGLYTSTNNSTWTPYSGNPILPFITSPYWTHFGTSVVVWGGSPMFNAILPTDIYRETSPDFHTWTPSPVMPVFRRETAFEGVNSIFGQVQDMCDVQVVPVAGDTLVYRYYIGTVNGNSSGGAGIELAIYNGSQRQLVAGNENADKFPRFENSGVNPYFNQPLAIGTPVAPVAMIDIEPITGRFGGRASIATGNITQDSTYTSLNLTYNMEFAAGPAGGWLQRNPTLVGYGINLSGNGITHYGFTAGATTPTPLAVETLVSGKYILQLGNVAATPNVYWGQATDNGSGAQFQMNGNSIQTTNITMSSQLNGFFVGKGSSAAINLQVSPTNLIGSSQSGAGNIFILNGMGATAFNGSGANNIIMGAGTGGAFTGGSNNIVLGPSAFQSNVSGNFCSIIGQAAFQSFTGSHGYGIGDGEGKVFTTGSDVGAIGPNAGNTDGIISSLATASNSLAIGDSTQVLASNIIVIGGEYTAMKNIGIDIPAPTSFLQVPPGRATAGKSSFSFYHRVLTTTAVTGTGTVVTFTFATQNFVPFEIGQTVDVTAGAPSGYIGSYVVTAVTLTTITVAGSTTGAQTSAFTITANGAPTTTDVWSLGPHADTLWWVGGSGTRFPLNFPSGSSVPTLQQVFNSGGGATSNLTQNDTILSSGGSTLFIGASGSNAIALQTYLGGGETHNNAVVLAGSIITNQIVTATDANFSWAYTGFQYGLILPNITANRTITMPGCPKGTQLMIFNRNTAAFTWIAGTALVDAAGNSITNLVNGAIYDIIYDGSNFVIRSISYSSTGERLRYNHTIFTPTTGGTVALVNNQYNIINPSGTLLALTVNLPSSPINNDVVYIKYTQSITTVTYGNGTVVDGITAPVAGGLVLLTYDAGTTSWY